MNEKYCQSCGMPLGEDVSAYATEKDGSRNEDYCSYCYKDGAYTMDCTMDEMIEFCVPHMAEGNPEMTENKAREMMQKFFPTLKRWRTAEGR